MILKSIDIIEGVKYCLNILKTSLPNNYLERNMLVKKQNNQTLTDQSIMINSLAENILIFDFTIYIYLNL